MTEIVRGKVERVERKHGEKGVFVNVTHKFGIPVEGPWSWFIHIPLDVNYKEGQPIAMHLETELEPEREKLTPTAILESAIQWIKASKPNDRSEKDRRYQILITDLEKALAQAVVYLDEEGIDKNLRSVI